jgi:hypothetical protein
MDRIMMTDDEMYRCEQYAAGEAAEVMYQEMQDANRQRAEAWYAAEEAERMYQEMPQD